MTVSIATEPNDDLLGHATEVVHRLHVGLNRFGIR
jgi:hypothetical protein